MKSLAVCALVAAAAALLPRRTRTANLYLLPIGVGVGAVAIIILALVDGGASRRANPGEIALLPRITLGLTLLVWPALGALSLRRKPKLGVWLGVVMVIAVLAAQTPLALGASAFGCLAFAAAMADQRIASRIAGFLGALIILGSPIFCWAIWRLYGTHAPHVLAPAALWGQFLSLDDLRALSGHGFDSARLGVAAGYLPPNTPRSALFEIWFELGLVGALGAALLTLWIARGVERMRADIAPVFLGGLTSAFTLCSFGLGVSMVWWVTLLALFAFAFALLRHGHARTARPRIKSPPR